MAKNLLSCRLGSYGQFAMHAYPHLAEIGVRYIEAQPPQGNEAIEMFKDILGEFNIQVASFEFHFDPLGNDANALSDPPGEYARKGETQRN